MTTTSPLANLPFDALVNVFGYLNTGDLLRIRMVSRYFREVAENSKTIRLNLEASRNMSAVHLEEDDEGAFMLQVHGPDGDSFERTIAANSLVHPPEDAYFLFSNVQTLTCQFYKTGCETADDRTKLEALAVGILNHMETGIFARLYYVNLLGLFFPEHVGLLNIIDMFPVPLFVRAEIYPIPGPAQPYTFSNNIRDVAIAVRQDPDTGPVWPRDRSRILEMFRFARGHVMEVVSLHNLGVGSVEQFCGLLAGATIKELLLERTGVVGTATDDFLTQMDKLCLKYARMRVEGGNERCSLRKIDAEHVSLDFFRSFSFSHVTSLNIMLFPEQNLGRGLLKHFPKLLNLTLRLPRWDILYNMPDDDFEASLVSQLRLAYHCHSTKAEAPAPHPHSLLQKLEKLQHLEHLEITSNYDNRNHKALEMPLLNETLYLHLFKVLHLKTLRFSNRYSVDNIDRFLHGLIGSF